MRIIMLLLVFLATSSALLADEGISIPWGEFKSLYRDSIEREVLKQAQSEKKPQVYSLDEARYVLNVDAETAHGEAFLSGTLVSGDPEPIPLFGSGVVITDVKNVTGGTVLQTKDAGQTAFLAATGEKGFQIAISFLLRPEADGETRLLSLGIPHAVRNSLMLGMPPESQVVEAPGIADAKGMYHFAACDHLAVRYMDRHGLTTQIPIEIDMLSRIRVQENRMLITTSLLPVRSAPRPLTLQMPEGAECTNSSSWIKKLDGNRLALTLPPGSKGILSLELALQTMSGAGETSLLLPSIEGNTGQQGRFVVEEPDDGQVTATAKGLVAQIPVERLGEELGKEAGAGRSYMTIPVNERLNLKITRFQSIGTPATVLESQCLFTSFEENGNVLSVLVMDVPPEVGPRLRLKAAPDSEIWSLTVNEAKKTVYAGEGDAWIIPLASGQMSHVELAFLRRGAKLGLQGRIETLMPDIGLPSRELRVAVGLPPRVELLSVEGPVSAAAGETWKRPAEFTGTPHYFSRSFHKGEEMKLAISYKEPVKQPQQEKGGAQ